MLAQLRCRLGTRWWQNFGCSWQAHSAVPVGRSEERELTQARPSRGSCHQTRSGCLGGASLRACKPVKTAGTAGHRACVAASASVKAGKSELQAVVQPWNQVVSHLARLQEWR